jgi:hypothetical protein
MDLFASIFNVIGEHINKLIDYMSGKGPAPKPKPDKFKIPPPGTKPPAWTRRKK